MIGETAAQKKAETQDVSAEAFHKPAEEGEKPAVMEHPPFGYRRGGSGNQSFPTCSPWFRVCTSLIT